MQQLIVLEDLKLEDVFSRGGSETLLKAIEEKATAFNPDTSTQAGRDKIKKMAADVGRCKKIIDDAGKGHKDQYLKMIQPIDSERRTIRESLAKLQSEVRKPLTDYEQEKERKKEEERKEKERIEAEKKAEIEAAELKKREEDEAERKKKQDEIDAENDRIKKEQEENQRKLDEQQAKIDAQNQKIEDDKRKVEEEKAQAKKDEQERIVEIVILKVEKNLHSFRIENDIRPEFFTDDLKIAPLLIVDNYDNQRKDLTDDCHEEILSIIQDEFSEQQRFDAEIKIINEAKEKKEKEDKEAEQKRLEEEEKENEERIIEERSERHIVKIENEIHDDLMRIDKLVIESGVIAFRSERYGIRGIKKGQIVRHLTINYESES